MSESIRTTEKNNCYLCGSAGVSLYKNIKDRLFGVPGVWNLNRCNNRQCSLIWLAPMPIKEDLPRLYETYYTHSSPATKKNSWLIKVFRNGCEQYLKKKYGYPHKGSILDQITSYLIVLNPEWTANLDFSVFYLPKKSKGKLLEIGCGSGKMLKKMQDEGWSVTGTDFDENSVSIARKLGLVVHHGDINELNLKHNTYDSIVMSHVIEHLPDPIKTLKECNRLLKPNGSIVLITPNTEGYNHKKYKDNSRILEPPRHLHLFNKSSLQNTAKNSGFKKIHTITTIRDYSGLKWASQNLSQNKTFNMVKRIPLKKQMVFSFQSFFYGNLHRIGKFEGDELVLIAEKQ